MAGIILLGKKVGKRGGGGAADSNQGVGQARESSYKGQQKKIEGGKDSVVGEMVVSSKADWNGDCLTRGKKLARATLCQRLEEGKVFVTFH